MTTTRSEARWDALEKMAIATQENVARLQEDVIAIRSDLLKAKKSLGDLAGLKKLVEMVKQDNRRQLSARVEQLESELSELRQAYDGKQEQENAMLQILMRVEQEQKVTEDARRFAEQDAAAQRNASQVFEDMPLKCCPEICLTGRFGQLFVFFRRLSFYFTTVGFYFCTMLTVLPWESVLRVWDVLLFSFVFSMPTSMVAISSSASEVRLWDATSIPGGPKHSFEGIKAARFSNSGSVLAALKSDPSQQEILLYGVHTCQLDMMLSDTSNTHSGRGHAYSLVHFSPSDSVLLWNGVLWDRRSSSPIHRFDRFTDHGGGGFHPAGNEVIINSEVWGEDAPMEIVLLLVVYLSYRFNEGGALSYIGIGVKGEESWEAWWDEELSHIRNFRGRVMETILSLRFFDGATCAAVLTHAILPANAQFPERCKLGAAGMNTIDLRRGISMAVVAVANLITGAGADRVLACDLHSGQFMGYFDIPKDHVHGLPIILDYLTRKTICSDDLVVVSPDVGGVARARAFAKKLSDAPLAIVDKRHHGHNVTEVMNLMGDVKGKVVVTLVGDPNPKATKSTLQSAPQATVAEAEGIEVRNGFEIEAIKIIGYGGLAETITSLSVISSAAGGAATLDILILGVAGWVFTVNNLWELRNERIEQSFDNNISPELEQRDRHKQLLGRKENVVLHAIIYTLTYIIIIVAVHWKGRPTEDDTWEEVTAFSAPFPEFSLGDKAAFKERGIVMTDAMNYQDQLGHGEGESPINQEQAEKPNITLVYSRRGNKQEQGTRDRGTAVI